LENKYLHSNEDSQFRAKLKGNILETGFCQTGTGLLELIMVLPLGLMIIFMSYDCAARFYQQALVKDLLRSRLGQPLLEPLENITLNGQITINHIALNQETKLLAKNINQSFGDALANFPGNSHHGYNVAVSSFLVGSNSGIEPSISRLSYSTHGDINAAPTQLNTKDTGQRFQNYFQLAGQLTGSGTGKRYNATLYVFIQFF